MMTTKTLNPLHFEDLEPHRFEDLVRQLAYDFRSWTKIEATGRLGSDEGIDIRAFSNRLVDPNDGERDTESQLWTFQCKREKSITPSKVKIIIDDSLPENTDAPYGFVLAAATDFSKKTRDTFYELCSNRGIQECHIWGKAELEDMLFQPKNDHLLFAYFGISLQLRRRSLKATFKSQIVIRKQLVSLFGDFGKKTWQPVLLRDANCESYPIPNDVPDFQNNPKWFYYELVSHGEPNCIVFLAKQHLAYLSDDEESWDALFDLDFRRLYSPLYSVKGYTYPNDDEKQRLYHDFWHNQIKPKNQAWYNFYGFINLERIIAIDEHGDTRHKGPHLIIDYQGRATPFEKITERIELASVERKLMIPKPGAKINFFPNPIPKTPKA